MHYVAVNNWVSPTGGIVYAMKYFQYLFVPLCAKYFYFSKYWQDGFDWWRAGSKDIQLTYSKILHNLPIVPQTKRILPGLKEFGPPTMWQAEADTVYFACHGSGPNSVYHGEDLIECSPSKTDLA